MEKVKYNKCPSLSVASVPNTTANDDINHKACDNRQKGGIKEDYENVIKCERLPSKKRNTSSLTLKLNKSYDSNLPYTNRLHFKYIFDLITVSVT